jgi:hypothetical protein
MKMYAEENDTAPAWTYWKYGRKEDPVDPVET